VRVGFLTQWYDPEGGSAAIPGAMVRSLESLGHEVEVVTGFPNYPQGRLYDGYRVRPWRTERLGPTKVHRVALYPSHDRSPWRRVANFLSFAVSAASLGAWRIRRRDVVLIYSTPATVGLAGVVLAGLWRRPFVLFIQDLWPDTVVATGMVPPRLTKLVECLLDHFTRWVYRSATRIAVISPGMRDILVGRGVPEDRIDLVYNWVDETVFNPRPRQLHGRRFDVMYAGNIGDVQGLEVAIAALAQLGDLDDVHLRLVGGGVAIPLLQELSCTLGVAKRVHFEGSRPLAEMPDIMASAAMQLVCLRDLPLFQVTMPSKMQAILACGLPVVVSAPGDVAQLAVDSGAGVAAEPGDAQALADVIRRAHAMPLAEREAMGRRGREFYERELCSVVGAKRLERSLGTALSQGPMELAR
jgi:glycosyltransferase involved in cell wall biosynthesis